jgi:hypothetical protein
MADNREYVMGATHPRSASVYEALAGQEHPW